MSLTCYYLFTLQLPYERFGECQQGANKPRGVYDYQGFQVLP